MTQAPSPEPRPTPGRPPASASREGVGVGGAAPGGGSGPLPAVATTPKAERERVRLRRELVRSAIGFLVAVALHAAILLWLYGWVVGAAGLDADRRIAATLDEVVAAEPLAEPAPPEVTEVEPPEVADPEVVDVVDADHDDTFSGEIGPAAVVGLGGGGGGGGGPRRPLTDGLDAFGGDDAFSDFVAGIRERGLDVVFVVDATASMDVFIAQAREMLDRIIADLTAVARNVRLGIVAYRDHGDPWLTRHVPLTTDRYRIHNFLLDLRAEGGGDWEEAVDEGLRVAVEEAGWREEARRVIILVGDAPVHEQDEPGALALVRSFARPRHALVNVLFTGSSPGRRATDRVQRAREAMARITRAGDGLLAELRSGDPDLRRRITDATFGPEWAEEIAELLASREVSGRERVARARIERGDRAWLVRELARDRGETRHVVVEGCVELFDATIARAALDLVLDETRPDAVRSAALYVLERSPRVRADVHVGRPLSGQASLVARMKRDVAALEAEARATDRRSGAPPVGGH